ncbi:MAG TPA: hypothetical protein VMX95_02855 [Thermodesulfobacteriota bacterium]|nr:hypothetical protein [Thermodesulfobacteriota bacterium]
MLLTMKDKQRIEVIFSTSSSIVVKYDSFSENLYLIPFNDGKGYYLRYHLEGW